MACPAVARRAEAGTGTGNRTGASNRSIYRERGCAILDRLWRRRGWRGWLEVQAREQGKIHG